MTAIDLKRTYLHLDGESAHAVPAERFWEKLAAGDGDPVIAGVAAGGWLVGTFSYDKTWDSWEVHPEGDEVVTLLSGEIDFVLEGQPSVTLVAGRSIVVPRGAWHRAIVKTPGAALHITFGRGTQHRAL